MNARKSPQNEFENPEERLVLGCVSTLLVGVISYWAIVGCLWELVESDNSGRQSFEDSDFFFMLSILAAPLAIPLLGFIVATLWRMSWHSMSGLRRFVLSPTGSASDP